jgi:tripartite-type tricarboxylate transporter receptor subunit TctC
VSIRANRKSEVGTAPIASKSRRTQRRLVGTRLHGQPLRVKATKLPRRQFLHLAAGAAALPVVSRDARAQTYPTKPVRMIVGFAAGGATDITARLIGQWLSDRLGQQFIIENRPGATANIATEAVVRAVPDGYTLLTFDGSSAINATLYGKLSFNFIRDITPIASIHRVPLVMQVHPSLPAETVRDFIAYAKSNPGKINMASGGTGTASHMSGEMFKMMAGVNLVHVPYRGEALGISDLLGGHVQVMFPTLTASVEYIRAGKVRALALTTASRSEALPGIPPVGDFLPGFEADSWYGIGAPKNTPAEVVGRLNKEINSILAEPKIKAQFAELGGTLFAGSPADFGKLIAEETEKWGAVVKATGIKLD